MTCTGGVPRIRGDDPTFTREAGNYTPVFPAYAGMILERENRSTLCTGVPRIRGDDPKPLI